MKSHVWRPLYVVIALVVLILLVRMVMVPEDFGVGERGYMYGWHRAANEQEWKDFKVKYRGRDYCYTCHPDKVELIATTPHIVIQCENCHGPAVDHPEDPPKLAVNTSREQCLRCHAYLPYDTSGRAMIRGIDDEKHNPGVECVGCHNPHKPGFD
jgi:hypothetical protein